MLLPAQFKDNLKPLLGEEWPDFLESLHQAPPTSIRINPSKNAVKQKSLEAVKWCDTGYYLNQRPVFTLDPAFHSGAYYVQEASSMFIAEIFRQCSPVVQKIRALDLCAAPGGKSTLLTSQISPDSLLVANEVIRSRYAVLQHNLQKWGYPNTYISNHDPKDFEPLYGVFDLVLTDAPCSGEGLFRKNKNAMKEWSSEQVRLCAARQRRILDHAKKLVRPGGLLIYSTCTFNDHENRLNVEWLSEDSELERVKIEINQEWGVTELVWGYQFFPHKVKGEGFFVSVFRKKPGEPINTARKKNKSKQTGFKKLKLLGKKRVSALQRWIEQGEQFSFFEKPGGGILAILKNQLDTALLLSKALKRIELGIDIGQFKNQDFIPSHTLALSTILSKNIPSTELSKQEALRYLKRESITIETEDKGWHLVTYQGLGLGWVKILPNRINNYLPKDWRVRMDISQ